MLFIPTILVVLVHLKATLMSLPPGSAMACDGRSWQNQGRPWADLGRKLMDLTMEFGRKAWVFHLSYGGTSCKFPFQSSHFGED